MNFGDDETGRAVEKALLNTLSNKPMVNHQPRVDPYDIRQVRADAMKDAGKRPDDWRQVMEHYDFVWYEPSQLDRIFGLATFIPRDIPNIYDEFGRPVRNEAMYFQKPREHGEWRNDQRPDSYRIPAQLQMAFTLQDLVTGFKTPAVFSTWFTDQIRLVKAKRAGLLVPGRRAG